MRDDGDWTNSALRGLATFLARSSIKPFWTKSSQLRQGNSKCQVYATVASPLVWATGHDSSTFCYDFWSIGRFSLVIPPIRFFKSNPIGRVLIYSCCGWGGLTRIIRSFLIRISMWRNNGYESGKNKRKVRSYRRYVLYVCNSINPLEREFLICLQTNFNVYYGILHSIYHHYKILSTPSTTITTR